jgi:tetratricopeptide (TPR) repeat protein
MFISFITAFGLVVGPFALLASADIWKARAAHLERCGRYGEAEAAYRRSLRFSLGGNNSYRSEVRLCAARACYCDGRIQDAMTWLAEAQAGAADDKAAQLAAHRLCAGICAGDGDLMRAAAEYKEAFALAREGFPPAVYAHIAVACAAMYAKAGHFADARAACKRAEEKDADGTARERLIVESDLLASEGRTGESLQVLKETRAMGVPNAAEPTEMRRALGSLEMKMAGLCLSTGDVEGAAAALDAAEVHLAREGRCLLWCEASRVWLAGLRGDAKAMVRSSEIVAAALARYADDRQTSFVCYAGLGMGALLAGDPEDGVRHFGAALEVCTSPVEQPRLHYHIAECHHILGDAEQTVVHLRRAEDAPFETEYTCLARAWLAQLG